jgi:acyl-CoA synthetase (AMP-forming)/AMP-acid ligase II
VRTTARAVLAHPVERVWEAAREAGTLVRAGVVRPARPDRTVAQLGALFRWGPTVAGGYLAAAGRAPGSTAVVDERTTRTFAELEERARRLAHGLSVRGVNPGSAVALMCRNHASMVESVIACSLLGADVVMVNTALSGPQVANVVAVHEPALVIADGEFAPMLDDVLPDVLPAAPRLTAWIDEPGGDESVADVVAASPPAPVKPPAEAGRIIVLTSGTTGTPKGARRRNPSGLGAAASVLSRIPMRVGERMLVAAPLFHTWGLAALQLGMALRATLVLERRFDAEATLRAVERHRCTVLVAVPVMLQRMLELPAEVRARYDLSSLRIVASSGSAMPGAAVTAFMDAFGDVLYNLYGSTEVSWASIAMPEDLRAAPTTAGRPPLGTRVAVLDEQGRPVPPGTTGRIFVGNDMLFEGYTGGDGTDGAKEVRHGLMATGDRGYADASGLLFVAGRDDDMIVSGGENVFPREVEELLAELPQVRDVAVAGVPDDEYGQRFAAFLVLHDGAELDADAVRAHVRRHLARFSVPRDVVFLDSLPRTATGKVISRVLPTLHA